jgi:hypothetical protein
VAGIVSVACGCGCVSFGVGLDVVVSVGNVFCAFCLWQLF